MRHPPSYGGTRAGAWVGRRRQTVAGDGGLWQENVFLGRVDRGPYALAGMGGGILDNHALGEDHQRTLTWLDSSPEWARAKDRRRLVKLLGLVRTEILFDADSSESAPPARANGSAFGANRGT